jgi:two-component system, OmpR family, sensor kinase
MSIRLRLTLWYSFVLAALLIVLDVSIYSILSNSLRANVDTQLNDIAGKILGASEVRSFADILQVAFPEDLDIFRSSDVGILVIDLDHNVVRRSSNVSTVNQSFDPDGLTVSTPPIYTTQDVLFAGAHLRVLTLPILVRNRQVGYLQVGGLLQGVDESLRQLSSILLIAGVFGVLAAALVGAFLARQALRPIDQITQTALSIARAGDLDKRIPTLGPPDEVGRLTETFNLMLDRLAGLFRAQQRFTADISHELRTPLTTIRGNVDLLKRFGGADPASLEAIRGETDRMIRLVGDLLLLAQADGGLPMRQEPVDLEQLAGEVVRQLQVIAGGVNVSLQTGPGEPVSVVGDPDRLRQLVLNLVDNAIKYTPPGGEAKVRVQCEDNRARLDVSDTGPGISPEHLKPGPGGVPLIFERFYRVEKSRSRAAGTANGSGRPGSGTGLGLSIAHWIVLAHSGQIDVQSELGKGTTFTVWLPLYPSLVQPVKLTPQNTGK